MVRKLFILQQLDTEIALCLYLTQDFGVFAAHLFVVKNVAEKLLFFW